jgi:hypothetical protein
MNTRLLINLILFEIAFLFLGYVVLSLAFFFYFGSGASASSESALRFTAGATALLVSVPVAYNAYHFLSKIKSDRVKANTHLIAAVIVVLFVLVIKWFFHL